MIPLGGADEQLQGSCFLSESVGDGFVFFMGDSERRPCFSDKEQGGADDVAMHR